MASSTESHPTISIEAGAPANETSHEQQQEFPFLARQTSIYSLTLDEFQHAICEPGKSFGSMNMDEFLTNIWNAEESQAVAASMQEAALSDHHHHHHHPNSDKTLITTQPSLPRQPSLSIPPPLSRKTVEEVWSEIHKEQEEEEEDDDDQPQQMEQLNGGNPGNAPRQPTLGEMTLEDFLIKAGVVRESCGTSAAPPPQPQFGYFRNNVEERGPGFGGNVCGGFGYADHLNTANGGVAGGIPAYQGYPSQKQQQVGSEGNRNGGGFPGVCYGGFGGPQPLSPVSSDGVGPSHVMDNSVSQYGGSEMRGGSARKRIVNGHPEKGVERRQRRMIKNRESAARSRARKQAYTVELEAELEMLKDENARLRKEQEEEAARRRKKLLEAMMAVVTAPSTKEKKCQTLRRTSTGTW